MKSIPLTQSSILPEAISSKKSANKDIAVTEDQSE